MIGITAEKVDTVVEMYFVEKNTGGTAVAQTIGLDSAETATLRYDDTITLPIESADGFFVIHVIPDGDGSPVLGRPDGSVTNPLLYDRDGDGAWTP